MTSHQIFGAKVVFRFFSRNCRRGVVLRQFFMQNMSILGKNLDKVQFSHYENYKVK